MIGTILGGLIIVLALIVTIPLCIVVARYEPRKSRELVELKKATLKAQYEYDVAYLEADWLTRFLNRDRLGRR